MAPLLFKKTSTKKILIVEDEPNLLKVLKIRVQSAGYEALTALDAYQGVQSAIANRPDLVILDLMMPAGGGYQALKNIRTSLLTKDLPVVILTGARDEELKNRVLEAGVAAYLEKPYNPEEFLETIRQILGEPSAGNPG